MVAVGTAEGDVFKLISECHAIVGVALRADEGKPIVGTIPHQVLYHLGGERREGGERERRRREEKREREEEEKEEEEETLLKTKTVFGREVQLNTTIICQRQLVTVWLS